jgi:hypothetical protein
MVPKDFLVKGSKDIGAFFWGMMVQQVSKGVATNNLAA